MFCNGVCNSQNPLTEVSNVHSTQTILPLHYYCLQRIEELQVTQEMVDGSYDALWEATQSLDNDNNTVQVS